MRSSRVRWASLLLLVSLLATLAPAAHGRAQASIEVTSSTATTSFPDAITFELEAGADDTVIAVDLVYQMSELETLQLLPADFEQDGELLTARVLH
jgi:methionine-rich copper-binding protein CopC